MIKIENAKEAQKDKEYVNALIRFLYMVADDELVIGHRDSEWLGVAPEIEEDIAFSSIAQDEVGHANYFYSLLEEFGEGDIDVIAFERKSPQRMNAVFVELPNGDWAKTILRHYLYDTFDDVRLDAMIDSSYLPIAFGARKMKREEHYHLIHMETLVRRLGTAGGEALERLKRGFGILWGNVGDLFALPEGFKEFSEFGILTQTVSDLQREWLLRIEKVLKESGIIDKTAKLTVPVGTRTNHSDALDELIETLLEVHEIDRSATW